MSSRVIAVVDDMFFASKIRATAEALGVAISFPRSKEALVEKVREVRPQLIVVDLHNKKVDPLGLARELKSDQELAQIQLVGFFSHVETELQRNALAAGFDRVLPRSAFVRDLPDLFATDSHE
jgi:CheY-like chemotaxis protein